jgi:hypothetical protein
VLSKQVALPLIFSALSWIAHTLLWANRTLRHVSTINSPFSCWLITSNSSSIPIVFHCRFMFLTHVGKKTQCCWRGNYMTRKITVAMDHLCQIALNQKLLLKFEKQCILVMLKQNHGKRNCIKWGLPVFIHITSAPRIWMIKFGETVKYHIFI